MGKVPVKEGYVSLDIPGLPKPCKTWYQLHGTIGQGQRPLVVLHGGPGVPHNYMNPLADLSLPPFNRPVILYDQLGCGNSTHLPEMKGEKGEAFWTVKLFLAELDAVVRALGIQDDYDVLGNSWGGMLAAEHALTQPSGLHHIVVADSPADMKDWTACAEKLRRQLPQDVQDALDKGEREDKTDAKEYTDAVEVFYKKHLCRLDPWPQDVSDAFKLLEEDNTVYLTCNGPSEFYVIGPLKDWNIKDRLEKIQVPVLLLNGRFDEAQDEVVMPYFTNIKTPVKWVQFAESSHMPHFEERKRYMEIVDAFLGHDESKGTWTAKVVTL